MDLRTLGQSGLRVSELGLSTGHWGTQVAIDAAPALLRAFLDEGGNLVDVASAAAMAEVNSGVHRRELVLSAASGVNPASPAGRRVDCSRRALLNDLDDILATLGLDHLDLWSVAYWDPHTPVEEVCAALDYAVDTGRVRYAGVRDYAGWQLAATYAQRPLVATQVPYSLLVREAELEVMPAAEYLGVGLIAADPLAHGVLSGEIAADDPHAPRFMGQRSEKITEALRTAAQGLGLSAATAAVAWVRQRAEVAATLVEAQEPEDISRCARATLPVPIHRALDDISR
ncbi:aldo/keto reductase [Corynebacterium lowii]|uniref:L-glyceraldehyde 3-phosphate reductase n=1 Tax=Corynebacterium lowii TaxID=1544413 RepID=A0A0N8W056_9CORY|nr:aldo/keto reductase [Corynebacterium lowii]KQB85762.1 L-glyceraldehyde 3-phosphate reductase [Corynebacterium lowii]MDP9851064.1 aryl-alcohol dehydrogenase-like predicted oxidoreductase [Corynebacterium lowii]